jgi:hypothetical protein
LSIFKPISEMLTRTPISYPQYFNFLNIIDECSNYFVFCIYICIIFFNINKLRFYLNCYHIFHYSTGFGPLIPQFNNLLMLPNTWKLSFRSVIIYRNSWGKLQCILFYIIQEIVPSFRKVVSFFWQKIQDGHRHRTSF